MYTKVILFISAVKTVIHTRWSNMEARAIYTFYRWQAQSTMPVS